jgi:hypothetical protein
MTLDELLNQLMRIKECYTDSGKFKIVGYDRELLEQTLGESNLDRKYELKIVKKIELKDEVVIK